jgi:SMI1 / KNR4 family (SUKH-1)
MTITSEPPLQDFDANGPPLEGALESVERHFGCVFPEQYKAFMSQRDGGEGFIGKRYLVLWRVEELIEFNQGYESNEYAPGLLLFGSNGGGEAFAFDLRDPSLPIRMVPFIGMSLHDAVLIADTFNNFLARLSEPHGTLP